METQKIKATLTMGKKQHLTLRVWLTAEQKEEFVLEKGTAPKTTFTVVVI